MKTIERFHINRGRKDGRTSECIDCTKIMNHLSVMKTKDKVFNLMGGKCVSCGLTDRRVLQIDHINDDGHLDREFGHGVRLARYISSGKRAIDDLQLLCANCHHLKSFWDGVTYAT